jgi:hypothetical protein
MSTMRFVFAPSPFQGEGWDGGEMVEASRVDFNVFTPSCAPRIGLQANAVQRAQRMRLESPASPPALPLKEGGGNSS